MELPWRFDSLLFNDKVKYIEFVGLQNIFTFYPEKVIEISQYPDLLHIKKERQDKMYEDVLINLNQIIYMRIVYKEVKEIGNR